MPPQIELENIGTQKKFTKIFDYLIIVLGVLICVGGVWYYLFSFYWSGKGCKQVALDTIKVNNYQLAIDGLCTDGYHKNSMLCIDSPVWCEPDQATNTVKLISTSTKTTNNSDYRGGGQVPGEIVVSLYAGADRKAFDTFITENGLKIIAEIKSINLVGVGVPVGKEQFYVNLFKKVEGVQYVALDYYAGLD